VTQDTGAFRELVGASLLMGSFGLLLYTMSSAAVCPDSTPVMAAMMVCSTPIVSMMPAAAMAVTGLGLYRSGVNHPEK